jgi:hypothetical protein
VVERRFVFNFLVFICIVTARQILKMPKPFLAGNRY